MAEEKTAQVRVKRRFVVDGHCGGTVFYCTPSRARIFLDQGAVELVGGKAIAPTEQPTAGPSETKTAAESSAAPPTGHSTDSAELNPAGAAQLPSSSEEGQALPEGNATQPPPLAEQEGAGSLLSTMRTKLRRKRT